MDGRWTTRDPIEELSLEQRLHDEIPESKGYFENNNSDSSYLFVLNNTVAHVDNLGLQSKVEEDLCIICACTIGTTSPGAADWMRLNRLNSVVQESIREANRRFKKSEPEQNAFRHCLGSCSSIRAVGPICALGAQACHEKFGTKSPDIDMRADLKNNSVGNGLSIRILSSCSTLCMKAMKEKR